MNSTAGDAPGEEGGGTKRVEGGPGETVECKKRSSSIKSAESNAQRKGTCKRLAAGAQAKPLHKALREVIGSTKSGGKQNSQKGFAENL